VGNVQNAQVYKAYRIHTTRLTFGTYISMIVSVGKRQLVTEDSLTDTVLRVPGEFFSKEEAFLAAKLYIDAEDSRRQA
jgi:hypothetical protein